jgi:uncharacterized protein (TIGR02271 family)
MQATDRTTVVGAFEHRRDAEKAVEDLHRVGFKDDQIGFAARDGERVEGGTTIEGTETHAGSGAAGGLVTGGVIGGILGALAAGLIPGIGPVIAGGILAGVLGGAAVGAAAGGLIGALIGMGVPEEEAHHYNREFEAGRTIVTVKADGRANEARSILQRYGVLEYGAQAATTSMREDLGSAQRPATTATVDTDHGRTVELREEELRARKDTVEAGGVELRKDVVTEEKTLDVPVTREEVVVERHPVQGRPSDRPIGENQTIEVPVREERVELEKQPVVYEEVEVGKRPVQDTERVSGTVRREEVRVEHEGDINVRETGQAAVGSSTWDTVRPLYQQEWQRKYGSSGGRWEQYEPGYRYGYEMANDPRYRGRQWTETEPSLRSDYEDWARRNHYTAEPNAWDRMKENVREAWESTRAKVGGR